MFIKEINNLLSQACIKVSDEYWSRQFIILNGSDTRAGVVSIPLTWSLVWCLPQRLRHPS